MRVLLAALNAKYIHASLALRYIKAYCRPLDIEIQVRDYTINNPLLELLGDVMRHKADAVGFACYIWNIELTLKLARLIRQVSPATKIILGGPEVSYDCRELLLEHDYVDYIVQGEGEQVMYELLACLADGRPCAVDGLAVQAKGAIAVYGGPQTVRELDSLPFPYDDGEMPGMRDKIIYYESSRGCPFACKYCLSSASEGVRYFGLERVLTDLAFFVRHNVKQVKFVDRTFNANKAHFLPILKFLAAQECDTNFHFEITADMLDEEVLALLETVPCGRFQFEIGIQSTYGPTLEEVARRNDWERIVTNVRRIQQGGNIHLHLDLIVGLPGEDLTHFCRSFNDVYALQPAMLQIGFLKLLKGSAMRGLAAKRGYVYMAMAPYEVLASDVLPYDAMRHLKLLADLFDMYYNSGNFQHTLRWLLAFSKLTPFALYDLLANFWEHRGYQENAHAVKALCMYLLEFCKEQGWPDYACRQFLKLDYLLHKSGKRPDLPWNDKAYAAEKAAFWSAAGAAKTYLPGFTFTTWREVNSNYQVEVFDIDVTVARALPVASKTVLLFICNRQGSHFIKIAPEDFFIVGQGVADEI